MQSEEVRFSMVVGGPEITELILEPWGEAYFLQPGVRVDVRAHGPAPADLEIIHGANRVVIFAWTGSTIDVLNDGRDLAGERGPRPTVPELPSGMRMRDYVKKMFGPFGG